jgi:hypothetical protein
MPDVAVGETDKNRRSGKGKPDPRLIHD